MADGQVASDRSVLHEQLNLLQKVSKRMVFDYEGSMTTVLASIVLFLLGGILWLAGVSMILLSYAYEYYFARQLFIWPVAATLRWFRLSATISAYSAAAILVIAKYATHVIKQWKACCSNSSAQEEAQEEAQDDLDLWTIFKSVAPEMAQTISWKKIRDAAPEDFKNSCDEAEGEFEAEKGNAWKFGVKSVEAVLMGYKIIERRVWCSIWIWFTVPLLANLISDVLAHKGYEGRGSYEALLTLCAAAWVVLPLEATWHELVQNSCRSCMSKTVESNRIPSDLTSGNFQVYFQQQGQFRSRPLDAQENVIKVNAKVKEMVTCRFHVKAPALFITNDKEHEAERKDTPVRIHSRAQVDLLLPSNEFKVPFTHTMEEVKDGMSFLVAFFSTEEPASDAYFLRSYTVMATRTGSISKVADRVHQFVIALKIPLLKVCQFGFGIAHVMLPYWWAMFWQQDVPCIAPLPHSCEEHCFKNIFGSHFISTKAAMKAARADNTTATAIFWGGVNASLQTLPYEAGIAFVKNSELSYSLWIFAPFQWMWAFATGPEWSCFFFPLIGIGAASVLISELALNLRNVYKDLSSFAEKLEDLNNLLFVYIWNYQDPDTIRERRPGTQTTDEETHTMETQPFLQNEEAGGGAGGEAEVPEQIQRHFKMQRKPILEKLEKLRSPISEAVSKFYELDYYPTFIMDSPQSDSRSLRWWFRTRSALLTEMEQKFQGTLPTLYATMLLVILLIVGTISRAVTRGLEFPLTAYCILDGVAFAWVMLSVVLQGAKINAKIDEGLKLAKHVGEVTYWDKVSILRLLRYHEHRPYYLYFCGAKLDSAFILAYGSSFGAYSTLILVSFFKSYFAPFLKKLE